MVWQLQDGNEILIHSLQRTSPSVGQDPKHEYLSLPNSQARSSTLNSLTILFREGIKHNFLHLRFVTRPLRLK